METTKRVLISGVVLDVSQLFSSNSILKVGVHANSQELARFTAANETQENKLKALQAGAKFKAVVIWRSPQWHNICPLKGVFSNKKA